VEDLTTAYSQTSRRLTSRLGDVFRQIGRVIVPVMLVGADESDASRQMFAIGALVAGNPSAAALVITARTRDLLVSFRILGLGTATRVACFINDPASIDLPNVGPADALLFQWIPASSATPSALVRVGQSTVIGGGFSPRLRVGDDFGPFLVRAGFQAALVVDGSALGMNLEALVTWREL
jgi:hypothetical protein